MERQHIAYLLIFAMMLAIAWWAAHARYNSRDRKIARQRAQETAARVKRQAQQP